jgi:hypothetical protein
MSAEIREASRDSLDSILSYYSPVVRAAILCDELIDCLPNYRNVPFDVLLQQPPVHNTFQSVFSIRIVHQIYQNLVSGFLDFITLLF